MNRKRRFVSLFIALTFLVLAVTGVLAFILPFSIQVVGLHALMGFLFIGLILLHVTNNAGHLSRYVRSPVVWGLIAITLGLTALFFWQPGPIRDFLGLSRNLGPDLDRFELSEDRLVYEYWPDPAYRMGLEVRSGRLFDLENPPHFAIWLENASFYHIKTLHEPRDLEAGRTALPYWDFKLRGWEKALDEAAESGTDLDALAEAEIDAVSGPTRNSSFDPAAYILPADPDNPMPYRLLIEIDQPGDEQPSLVYAVEIDNLDPRTFQLLDIVGYPVREEDDEDGDETWALYYVDDRFTTALDLIDSALLTIERDHGD